MNDPTTKVRDERVQRARATLAALQGGEGGLRAHLGCGPAEDQRHVYARALGRAQCALEDTLAVIGDRAGA